MSTDPPAATIKGIDIESVSRWLQNNVEQAVEPFDFKLIAAGGSNLTFRVTDSANHVWALRRPPVAARLATAHDMQREWKIMAALKTNTDVPVPSMIAYCNDLDVNEAPFYVMDFVEGLIIRDQSSVAQLSVEQCLIATESLVDVQVAFHTVDIDGIGLGDLAKTRDNYVERQLNRWKKQITTANNRELPIIDELHSRLSAKTPKPQAAPGLAHGDYRFDNTVLGEDFRIQAVLDWELCTLGDPIADFVWSLLYWAEPGEELTWLLDAPTKADQFIRRDGVVELYAQRSGFDLADIDYYKAFSWWKQACIVEGVYARLLKGASGGMKVDSLDLVAERVEAYLDCAAELANQAGI